jgi:hypothetical protein
LVHILFYFGEIDYQKVLAPPEQENHINNQKDIEYKVHLWRSYLPIPIHKEKAHNDSRYGGVGALKVYLVHDFISVRLHFL